MFRYEVIADLSKLEEFIDFLPETTSDEVYFMSLMARSKDASLPKVKNSEIYGTKRAVKKKDIVRCLREYEIPIGGYARQGVEIQQGHLSPYITINPRSLSQAAKKTCLELTNLLITSPDDLINPADFSMRMIHQSVGTKHFIDFDFDNADVADIHEKLKNIPLPTGKTLITKGGFHLIYSSKAVGSRYNDIVKLGCDVHGSSGMIPIPGCYQRGFVPYFSEDF